MLIFNARFTRVLLATAIGVGAALAVLSINASPLTPGVHSDGVQYLSAAESFAERMTFTVPVTSWRAPLEPAKLTHYPPGFSALIAIPVALGVSPPAAALWIIAASAGVAASFAFLLGSLVAGSWGGAVATLLLIATPAFTRLHLAVWSEPSYLAVTLAMIYAMVRRPGLVGVHALLAAAALSIRYVGIAGTAAVMVWAALQERAAPQRIRKMAWAAVPSLLLLLAWWAYSSAGSGSVRRLGWYPGTGRSLGRLGGLAVDWLVPSTLGAGVGAAAGLSAAAAAVVVLAKRDRVWSAPEARRTAACALIYALAYGAVLVASRAFLDPRIPFDFRLFSPIVTLATVAFGASAAGVAITRRGLVAGVIVVGLTTWIAFSFVETRRGVHAVNADGMYYTHRSWLASPLIDWIREAPSDLPTFYSNEPELVHFLTGRPATSLPRAADRADLDLFRARFLETPGPVVLAYPMHADDLAESVVAEAASLESVLRTSRGVILVPRRGGGR